MIFSIVVAFLAGISAAQRSYSSKCLTDASASKVAFNFQHLFQDYSPEFVDTVLAVDFTGQTDSVAWLMSNATNCPKQLGAPTLTGIEEFKVAQSAQPNLPFPILNVYHNCDSVFVRWKFDIEPQVQGIAILNTIPNPLSNSTQPFLIKNVFSEFNTGAFTQHLGYYKGTSPPSCNASSNVTKRGSADEPWYGNGTAGYSATAQPAKYHGRVRA